MEKYLMMRFFLLFIVIFFTFQANAQTRVVKFEPGLISNGGVFGLSISPDGREAFWVSSNGGRDTLLIFQSTLENGK